MKKNETKRVALVTGAASGIGRATAELLSSVGYSVYGTSRKLDATSGLGIQMLELDVTRDASVERCVEEVIRREGRIDLLVNNAGFGIAPAAAEESSLDQARALFDANFFGIVRMTRAVVPHLRRQKGGRIVNIGSVVGFLPMPYMALYSASKHAVAGYSEALDHELRTFGIRVSVVEPAYVKTPFDANQVKADSPIAIYRAICEGIERRIKQILVTADSPEIVAKAVLEAAESAQPMTHYTPGRARRLRLLRSFAPSRVMDAGVRKDIGLAE